MKILTLLRHAKSGWDDPAQSDFDRPLNRRGRRGARAVGAEMRRLDLAFDRVLASPARRVVETIEEVEKAFGRLSPVYDPAVYLAPAETLLELIRAAPDAIRSLMIVGHNPGLESLALLLAGPAGPLRDAVAIKYPTGALAEFRLDLDRWRDAGPGDGTLARFIRPRDLDPDLGPEPP
jgi:phosphohistidine phosphatase